MRWLPINPGGVSVLLRQGSSRRRVHAQLVLGYSQNRTVGPEQHWQQDGPPPPPPPHTPFSLSCTQLHQSPMCVPRVRWLQGRRPCLASSMSSELGAGGEGRPPPRLCCCRKECNCSLQRCQLHEDAHIQHEKLTPMQHSRH